MNEWPRKIPHSHPFTFQPKEHEAGLLLVRSKLFVLATVLCGIMRNMFQFDRNRFLECKCSKFGIADTRSSQPDSSSCPQRGAEANHDKDPMAAETCHHRIMLRESMLALRASQRNAVF
jgi:hypothetical protein